MPCEALILNFPSNRRLSFWSSLRTCMQIYWTCVIFLWLGEGIGKYFDLSKLAFSREGHFIMVLTKGMVFEGWSGELYLLCKLVV